jgi:hypothetical protein
MLFRKKMQPSLHPAWMPEPVRRTVAYMVRGDVPPGMARVNPERTSAWIGEVMRERGTRDAPVRDAQGMPLISDGKTFQLIRAGQSGETIHLAILTWEERQNEPTDTWSAQSGDKMLPIQSLKQERVAVPNLVWQELGENGLLIPPKHVGWLEFTIPAGNSGELRLSRRTSPTTADTLHFVPSFTKLDEPTN